MFPLTILFAVGFIKKDDQCHNYTGPLVLLGVIIAAYHNLLYYGLIEKSIVACTKDLSCTSKQLELFGFVTIPLLSLLTFLVLTAFSIYSSLEGRKSYEKA